MHAVKVKTAANLRGGPFREFEGARLRPQKRKQAGRNVVDGGSCRRACTILICRANGARRFE